MGRHVLKSRKTEDADEQADSPVIPPPVVYPKVVEVSVERKEINLPWFGERYRINSEVKEGMLDHFLAVYCVAKQLPHLPTSMWKHFFSKEKELPGEVASALAEMRDTYCRNYPKAPDNSTKNWKNIVRSYIRNMMRNTKQVKTTMLFFFKLLGLFEANVSPKKLNEVLGEDIKWMINSEFSGNSEALFNLVLPPELLLDYTGRGWPMEEVEWINNLSAIGKSAEEQMGDFVETKHQRSAVYWKKELVRIRKSISSVEGALLARKNLVAESEAELFDLKKEEKEAVEYLELATQKEGVFTIKGSPQDALKKVRSLAELTKVLENDDIPDEQASVLFIQIKREWKDVNPPSQTSSKRQSKEPVQTRKPPKEKRVEVGSQSSSSTIQNEPGRGRMVAGTSSDVAREPVCSESVAPETVPVFVAGRSGQMRKFGMGRGRGSGKSGIKLNRSDATETNEAAEPSRFDEPDQPNVDNDHDDETNRQSKNNSPDESIRRSKNNSPDVSNDSDKTNNPPQGTNFDENVEVTVGDEQVGDKAVEVVGDKEVEVVGDKEVEVVGDKEVEVVGDKEDRVVKDKEKDAVNESPNADDNGDGYDNEEGLGEYTS